MKLFSKGVHGAPLGSKGAILKKGDENEVLVPKRGYHNPVNAA